MSLTDALTFVPGPIGRIEINEAVVNAAVRAERRPLPSHDLNGVNYRKWAAAVLAAEVKHSRDDFWSVAHKLGAVRLGLFDRDGGDRDADVAFRFPHERAAGVAAVWLLHLQTHDNDRFGPWSRWLVMSHDKKVAWARRRRELLSGFLKACHAYQRARAAVDAPVARAA